MIKYTFAGMVILFIPENGSVFSDNKYTSGEKIWLAEIFPGFFYKYKLKLSILHHKSLH